MNRIASIVTIGALAVLSATACERVKSATPLSPSLAGPIAGVEISLATAVSPQQNERISATDQPITFVVENATTTSVRPLMYRLDVAADINFANIVYSQHGIKPGEGRTSIRMPSSLASDRVYFWRVKAYDGANEGDFSATGSFVVFTPVTLGAPGLASPGNGATMNTLQPVLTVVNGTVSGPAGSISYVFEVATNNTMANRVAAQQVAAGSGQTAWTLPSPLQASTTYHWRARAVSASGHQSAWSPVWTFVTPAAAAAPPPGGGGGNVPPSAGDQIDLRTVTFANAVNISGWAVTSTVLSAAHIGDQLCIDHTKAGKWPQLPFFDTGATIEGNQWFFANIGGKWIGGANEWLRPGQTCKVIDGHVGQGGFGGTALAGWTPKPGEMVGVAVSTPARNGQQGTAERSNVVIIRW
jgi:hypothetical protein